MPGVPARAFYFSLEKQMGTHRLDIDRVAALGLRMGWWLETPL